LISLNKLALFPSLFYRALRGAASILKKPQALEVRL
jgi:hypothetical protein